MTLKERFLEWLVCGAVEKDGLRRKLVMYRINKEVNQMDKFFEGSWKPKALGALGLVSALVSAATALLDGDPKTNVDITALMTQVSLCVALFTVRQNDKSSEDVGAK